MHSYNKIKCDYRDKIKPSPTAWIALTQFIQQTDMDTSEINNDARFADDDNNNNEDNNMGSINSTYTCTQTVTVNLCLLVCISLQQWCKENENGLSKSFISFIQSKRKQQQHEEERIKSKTAKLELQHATTRWIRHRACVLVYAWRLFHHSKLTHTLVAVVVVEVGVEMGKTISQCTMENKWNARGQKSNQKYIQP